MPKYKNIRIETIAKDWSTQDKRGEANSKKNLLIGR